MISGVEFLPTRDPNSFEPPAAGLRGGLEAVKVDSGFVSEIGAAGLAISSVTDFSGSEGFGVSVNAVGLGGAGDSEEISGVVAVVAGVVAGVVTGVVAEAEGVFEGVVAVVFEVDEAEDLREPKGWRTGRSGVGVVTAVLVDEGIEEDITVGLVEAGVGVGVEIGVGVGVGDVDADDVGVGDKDVGVGTERIGGGVERGGAGVTCAGIAVAVELPLSS